MAGALVNTYVGGVVRQRCRSRKPRGEAPSGKARLRCIVGGGYKNGATQLRVAPRNLFLDLHYFILAISSSTFTKVSRIFTIAFSVSSMDLSFK